MKSLVKNKLLDKKDRCLEDLRKLDKTVALWQEQHLRTLTDPESKSVKSIQTLLEKLAESEQQFEMQLEKEKMKYTAELGRVGNHSQVKNYLGTQRRSGKTFNFRR